MLELGVRLATWAVLALTAIWLLETYTDWKRK